MSADRSNVAILKNVIRIGETGVLFKDIKSVHYDDSDGDRTARVKYADGGDSGWFDCTLEQFDTLLNAWDNYIETRKDHPSEVKHVS